MQTRLHKLKRLLFRLKYLFAFFTLAIHSGCFVTTHSFNNGKLLDPGERLLTTGFGWKYSARFLKHESYTSTEIKSEYSTYYTSEYYEYYDSTRFGWFNFTLDYRVGILRKYPFGKGLETGFHLETAMRGDQELNTYIIDGSEKIIKNTNPEFFSPPLLEFDTRFGLPDITLKKGVFHHNANLGWVVGQWIDNGWFLGYAAGVELKRNIFYGSFRYLITGTNMLDEEVDTLSFAKHDRTHGIRLQCGTSIKLRLNETVLPEYITPEISLLFPNFNKVQPVGFSFSIGIGWKPGF